MFIELSKADPSEVYFIMSQTIIPRPIAWVLSDNGNGSYNLAPFSYFNAVASHPPIFMISVGYKDETTRKDTWVNIDERKDFVVHIPSVDHFRDVVDSSLNLPHGKSEIEHFKMKLIATEGEKMPRLEGVKVAFFCEKYAIQEIGNGEEVQGLILGKIKSVWLDDKIVKINKNKILIDPKTIDPLARLGGTFYAPLGEIISTPPRN